MGCTTESHEVVVVGAGVAGAALAAVLARDGRRVLVIERDLSEPKRIVGELLQPGGCQQLRELGLEAALEGIDSQRVYGYGMFLYDRKMCIDYVERRAAAGWAGADEVAGRSFHNGRFVQRLREAARAEPNCTLVQGTVTRLLYEREGDETSRVCGVAYTVAADGGAERMAHASLTIACDGCASRLRRMVLPVALHSISSYFVGLILQHCELPFPQHGHVVLADPAPVLFYPISSTEVRCLVDVPLSARSAGAGGDRDGLARYLRTAVAPQVPDALRPALVAAIDRGDFKLMPNRVMPARPVSLRGALLLGDSFNMRHPLTGGGMTVALSDVRLIRAILRSVPDLADDAMAMRKLQAFYSQRKPLSSTINILADALYAVMCATDDPALKEMRSACFDYLASGGRRSTDPMAMLGGLRPSPYLLAGHFFAVAGFGIGRVLLPLPTPDKIAQAWKLFCAAFNIVKPLIDAERVTLLAYIPVGHIPTGRGRLVLAAAAVAVALVVWLLWR